MERGAFTLLGGMERSWWYRGRAFAVRTALWRSSISHVDSALDFGAGFGGMRATLHSVSREVSAFEPDAEAKASCERRGYTAVFASAEEALAGRYDLIGLFDVLEHIEDDVAFLMQAYAALAHDGAIVISVPAFPFLWSAHDVSHHHFRRYTKHTLSSALERAGFAVVFKSYWNMTLFFPAAVMRMLGTTGESGLSLPPFLNALLFAVVRCEAALMRFFSLPLGSGLVVVARKRAR